MMDAMRLATIRTPDGIRCVRVDDDFAVETGHTDVGELLADRAWRELAAEAGGRRYPVEALDYATLVPRPEKVICVGLNYKDHIAEMGNQLPDFPTLFPKYARTLTGAFDPIPLPPESSKVDWEAELTVVIGATPSGATVRRADAERALAAIAGYTVANDISMRDFQRNTNQFLAGKVWEASTPVGPWLVVPDEPGEPARPISCEVDGETVQSSNTDQLLFGPIHLVQYISTLITLAPGDLILTGTPGGVGAGRTPPRFLQPGETLATTIEGIGRQRNVCIAETVDVG
jgi:acylpyruvate hydrolase